MIVNDCFHFLCFQRSSAHVAGHQSLRQMRREASITLDSSGQSSLAGSNKTPTTEVCLLLFFFQNFKTNNHLFIYFQRIFQV